MGCFVGIDGGGTKTAAAAVDEAGRVVGSARAGPASFKSVGLARAADVIVGVLRDALAGQPPATAVLAAVSDVDTAADRAALRAAIVPALERAGLQVERLDVCNDALAALASGTGGLARGVACIAGTGSIALGLDGRGGEARAGGWGPPYGDGGSAYWIGFRAISLALEQHDAGRRATPLIGELLAASGCRTLPDLVFGHAGAGDESPQAAVYRERVAALARAAERAALAGDPDAVAAFHQAGQALGRLVRLAVGRLELGGDPFDVVQVGSVWQTGVPALLTAFEAEIAGLTGARPVRPSVEPAVGAARLIRQLVAAGQDCPGGLIEAG